MGIQRSPIVLSGYLRYRVAKFAIEPAVTLGAAFVDDDTVFAFGLAPRLRFRIAGTNRTFLDFIGQPSFTLVGVGDELVLSFKLGWGIGVNHFLTDLIALSVQVTSDLLTIAGELGGTVNIGFAPSPSVGVTFFVPSNK